MRQSVGCGSGEFGVAAVAGDVVLAEWDSRFTPDPAFPNPYHRMCQPSLRRTHQNTNNNYYNGCHDNNRNLITATVEVLQVRRTV